MICKDQNQCPERQELVRDESVIKEEKSLRVSNYKLYLLIVKGIPHFMAFLYALYTLLEFCGIDGFIIGSFTSMSILTWIYLYTTSIVFKFCYVHRLPLYYILVNEAITDIDYYMNIPISVFSLLILHILATALLIFGYSIYYLKFR